MPPFQLTLPSETLALYVITVRNREGEQFFSLDPAQFEAHSELSEEELNFKLVDALADSSGRASWTKDELVSLRHSMRDALRKGPYPSMAGPHLALSGGLINAGFAADSVCGKHFSATLFVHPNKSRSVQIEIGRRSSPQDLIDDEMNFKIRGAFGDGVTGCSTSEVEDSEIVQKP